MVTAAPGKPALRRYERIKDGAMRIFELTTRVKSISRAHGRTATAAAAYRSGTSIRCVFAQAEHDYSRKGGVVHSEIVLPADAPAWAKDRSALWNAAELVEKNGKRGKNAGAWKKTAQTAREVMFSFPHELSDTGRETVARRVAAYLTATGVAVDVNIHAPGKEGDQRNWHCHLLMTTRVFKDEEFGPKVAWQTNRAASRALSKDVRAFIAETANDQLKAEGKGHLVHVEHRSFKVRGIDRTAQQHAGPHVTGAQRRDKRKAREDWQAEVAAELREKQVAENKALREAQNAAWRDQSAKWAKETSEQVKRIIQASRAERRADARPAGLKGFLLRLTGQAKRAETQRKERSQARLAEVRQQVAAVRGEIDRQKAAVRTEQQTVRQAVKDRHAGETMQLTKAFTARMSKDLAGERSLRATWDRQHGHEQEVSNPGRMRSLDL